MIILNLDGREVVLTVTPPKRAGVVAGISIVLRETYRTDSLARTVAAVMAKRLGLRRRGTAWIRVNSK